MKFQDKLANLVKQQINAQPFLFLVLSLCFTWEQTAKSKSRVSQMKVRWLRWVGPGPGKGKLRGVRGGNEAWLHKCERLEQKNIHHDSLTTTWQVGLYKYIDREGERESGKVGRDATWVWRHTGRENRNTSRKYLKK